MVRSCSNQCVTLGLLRLHSSSSTSHQTATSTTYLGFANGRVGDNDGCNTRGLGNRFEMDQTNTSHTCRKMSQQKKKGIQVGSETTKRRQKRSKAADHDKTR